MQDQNHNAGKAGLAWQFTAGIAHEIKNPLNFVVNFSELIIDLSRSSTKN
jgi:signal transduction histidine kinase